MTQRDVAKQKPIGAWLKYADEVITEHVDRVLSDNGFTRFCWQVLNIIYQAAPLPRAASSTPCRPSSTDNSWARSSTGS